MHPILFHVGSLPVRSYGVLIVAGLLVGLWRARRVCWRRMQQPPVGEPEGSPRRIDPDAIFDIGFWGFMSGIVGARLLYVLLDWQQFATRPGDALKLWEGGMSLHGGLFLGIGCMVALCRWKRLSILAVGDVCAVSWAIAYMIGRFGCLFNGCCYGGVCDLPWGVRFPDEQHPGLLTPPSHPVPLYGSLFNLAFFLGLAWWERKRRPDGEIFWAYLGLYGLYRYIVEAFRAGTTSTYAIPALHLTDTHIISLIMMLASVVVIVLLRRHRPAYKMGELPPSEAGANVQVVPVA